MFPLLSMRAALERYPRQLRFFVALLAILSFVAPSWHVCALGGHLMMGCEDTQTHHSHLPGVKIYDNGPLICFCAAPEHSAKYPEYIGAKFDGLPSMDHADCLALLLQSLPSALSSPFQLRLVTVERPAVYHSRWQAFTPAAQRLFSGRAPPVDL